MILSLKCEQTKCKIHLCDSQPILNNVISQCWEQQRREGMVMRLVCWTFMEKLEGNQSSFWLTAHMVHFFRINNKCICVWCKHFNTDPRWVTLGSWVWPFGGFGGLDLSGDWWKDRMINGRRYERSLWHHFSITLFCIKGLNPEQEAILTFY